MPKKNNESGGGCGCILMIIGILLAIGLWQQNPLHGIIATVALVIIGVLLIGSPNKDQCEICGNPTRGTNYTWPINGKEAQVCSKCNQRLECQRSKQAIAETLTPTVEDNRSGNKTIKSDKPLSVNIPSKGKLDPLTQIQKLAELKTQGVISEEEFQTAKQKLLTEI
jgi:hypothetical protein